MGWRIKRSLNRLVSLASDKTVYASLHIPDQQVIFFFVDPQQGILHPGIAAMADTAPDHFRVTHIAAFGKAGNRRLPVKQTDICIPVIGENIFLRELGRQPADILPAGKQVFLG